MSDTPTPANNLSSVHRVFALEELFRPIYDSLNDDDTVKLLHLSRHMFASAASVVWADVDLQQVLLLIPGAKYQYLSTIEYNHPHTKHVFDLPATMDLTRLELYAPFVKRVHTSGSYIVNLPDQWKKLRQAAMSKPLLPNLLHFRLCIDGPVCFEDVKWSTVFLGPKLLSFKILPSYSGSNPLIEEDACCELIAVVSEMCPCLEKLHIFSRRNSLMSLSTLSHLRSFTINERGMGSQVLQALGRLPHLERLSIIEDRFDRSVGNEVPIELPDDSFPSLRNLSLDGVSPFPLSQICTSPKLFRNLVTANIFYSIDSCEKSKGSLERLNVAVFSLGHNSPHITHLGIYLDSWFAPSWPIIEAFKQMPLRYLNLYLVVFGSEDYVAPPGEETPPVYYPTIGWRDFLAAVPLLEELHLTRQTLEPNQLPIFAYMLPRLRLLALRGIRVIGTERMPDATGWPRPATQAITIHVDWYSMTPDVSSITRSVVEDGMSNLDS